MLRITIELVPGGIELESRAVASMQISNVSDLADCSDYEDRKPFDWRQARKAECMVVAHHRRQGLGPLGEGVLRITQGSQQLAKILRSNMLRFDKVSVI